jgi:hypothetical protein
MSKGPSVPEILLGLAQIRASDDATATANRRLDREEDERRRIQKREDEQRQEDKDEKIARKAFGAAGFTGLRSGIEAQLRQGLITYDDAIGQLRGHGAKFDLDPEEAVSNLTNLYTEELLPGRRTTGIAAAFEEILQRPVTEEEKKTSMDRFNTGYYRSVQDLKDSLTKGSEYQDKFNNSYFDNYYDTMYGKQERDAAVTASSGQDSATDFDINRFEQLLERLRSI